MYQDKYKLTPQQSAFLAKKKWDENVYCGMRMENRAVTFPQTRTIWRAAEASRSEMKRHSFIPEAFI